MPNQDGQPNRWFNFSRRMDRGVHELLGLAKGLVADGVVTDQEVRLLREWSRANPEAAMAWPGNVLAERLDRIFADRRIDDAEREDLRGLLEDLTAADAPEQNASSRLPLNDPPPVLRFDGAVYVFTGRFFYGARGTCQLVVENRGGICGAGVTRRTNYLVIGELGSRDWKHTSFGRKIQRAVGIRSDGYPLAIIGEEHWASYL